LNLLKITGESKNDKRKPYHCCYTPKWEE